MDDGSFEAGVRDRETMKRNIGIGMLIDPSSKEYRAGRSAARKAIKLGVPRWTSVASNEPYKCIDDQTGLPIIELAQNSSEIGAFASGANDEILKAISNGLITVDFRPMLLTETEIKTAFKRASIGTLSDDNPMIEFPGVFIAKLRSEKSRKTRGVHTDPPKRNIFIELKNRNGQVFKDFALYPGPVELALALKNRVLLFKTTDFYFSKDLETSQILNRYPRRDRLN